MLRGLGAWATSAALLGCGSTVDPVGYDTTGGEPLRPLDGPASYPNLFAELLGRTEAEIDAKLEASFQRLFHGDPANEAIYFTVGDDQAYIQDVLHGDVRSEGVGLGMMIALQLEHREEFDRLARYAGAALQYSSGPNRGYLRSSCNSSEGAVPCADPFGHQQIATALLFAHGRWGSTSGTLDYGAEARRLLEVMREKERQNGGVVDGVTNMVDESTHLVFDVPHESARGFTRPSNVMPAYYELWAQATADPFWSEAAESARAYLRAAAHPQTGLWPVRAHFDGRPVAGSEAFDSEAYRTQLNVALDHVWFEPTVWYETQANRLLGFFASRGLETYGTAYSLDGAVTLNPAREAALIAANGATAVAASLAQREAFVAAAWAVEPPTGAPRYYPGLLHLTSLLILSGRMQVY